MRPLRTYIHRYIQMTPEEAPGELTILSTGRTPCAARNAAFLQLEQRLVREQLRGKWRLVSQAPVPAQGSHVVLRRPPSVR